MKIPHNSLKYLLYSGLLVLVTVSCSHKYNSNELDLGFYQWNMWPDKQAGEDGLPSCGWEDLHRGMGALVRIPARVNAHFEAEELSGITWFHCRFTLPEMWEHRQISLKFEGISHPARIYLNELEVGHYSVGESTFNLDVTESIYYVRDNHLAIRIADPEKASGGLTGSVWVSSMVPDHDQISNKP
jgi:hypothetical protein